MPRMPRWMLKHRVTIEPFTGDSATGPVYGAPITGVRALAVAKTTNIRTADGKTGREIKRCLARYVARDLYRLLESGPAAA